MLQRRKRCDTCLITEPAEALRTLAWIVVDGEKKVSRSTIATIRELASGAVSEADMPGNLDAYGIE